VAGLASNAAPPCVAANTSSRRLGKCLDLNCFLHNLTEEYSRLNTTLAHFDRLSKFTSVPALSQRLQRNLPEGFFRVLAWSSSAVYVDCVERLVESSGEAGRLPLAEARALVQETVLSHPSVPWTENEGGLLVDARIRASRVFNNLLNVSWIEEKPESLHDRWIIMSPALRPLLRLLQELASEEIGELKSFADTLESACRTLEIDGILDPAQQPAGSLRGTISELNKRLEQAISQLFAVEKVIHMFEQRQLQSVTGAETLQIIYSDFNQGQHMVCYDVLHRRGLLPRLHRARNIVRDAADNPFLQQRLAESIATEFEIGEDEAWNRAGEWMVKLTRALGGIRQRAEAVDSRIASFHQLSKQRYFYQSQMRGRRPELAKAICDAVNSRWAEGKFSDLDGEPMFKLRATEVELFHGTSSLATPRRGRMQPSLSLGSPQITPPDEAELERLRERQRVAVTPQRAARLINVLLPTKGATITTRQMEITTEEAFLDLIAAASFNQFIAPEGRMRWQVRLARRLDMMQPDHIARDAVMDWKVKSFQLERIA